jgi:hypothetical protein
MINLGSAGNFAVLGGTSVTNTGDTIIVYGNVGVSPGGTITGFPPGVVNGTIDTGGSIAAQAQTDLTNAYNAAAGEVAPPANTAGTLTYFSTTLMPGVYSASSTIDITGTLTLNGNGVYIFQAGSTLTAEVGSQVILTNGAQANDVFWQVGSSATILGGSTAFEGTVLALTSITVTSGVTMTGNLLAQSGTVTLDSDNITAVPEPACTSILIAGFMGLAIGAGRIRRHYSNRKLDSKGC